MSDERMTTSDLAGRNDPPDDVRAPAPPADAVDPSQEANARGEPAGEQGLEPPRQERQPPAPAPPADTPRSDGGHPDEAADHATLLDDTSSSDYRARWERLQIGFVDSPAATVAEADELVAEILQRIAQTFADERGALERQWSGEGEPSTEDLRVALQRYRAFFARLLSV